MKEREPECQVPACRKKAVKEIHYPFSGLASRGVMQKQFLCLDHFKALERYFKKKNIPREIFNLEPTEDDREVVQFT